MVENGLSPDTALAALTTVPAQMLGADAYLGTVTAGKMANLMVSTAPYFEEGSQVRYVFVEGDMFEYEVKKKKKKMAVDENAEPANIKGSWSYEVEVYGDTQTGTIKFVGNDGNYEGELISDQDGETTELSDIEVNGNVITFSMTSDEDGQPLQFDFQLEVTDDVYEGNVSVAQFGSFPIEGEKVPDQF